MTSGEHQERRQNVVKHWDRVNCSILRQVDKHGYKNMLRTSQRDKQDSSFCNTAVQKAEFTGPCQKPAHDLSNHAEMSFNF